MITATRQITAEELLAMGDMGRCELIRGELIMMSPSSAGHGVIVGRLALLIGTFVEEHDLGVTLGAETGFKITSEPDTVRAPDIAVVLKRRVAQVIPRRGFARGAPDLAVEVLSPDDSRKGTIAKAKMWLQRGATSVWVVDPNARAVDVYHVKGKSIRHLEDGALVDDAVLPGFSIPLKQVFRVI